MTPRRLPKMKLPKPPTPGHYRTPQVRLPGMGGYNAPRTGRIGKQMPSPRKPQR